ncbi:transmembrane protease serine 9-like [Anopheles nili]|uniref:transmembrane protease serine 9-like n=1 Tax=Anopheles nili TaxID=185578 RepID=UPI00237C34BE|nr:transmembrane protease serine 9-like [Anopheles nili]
MSLTAWKVNACLVTFCVLTIAQTIALLECGERKIKTVYLVQHGTETKEGFWPWHTAIYHREGAEYNYVCGGSIIDHNTILTAAHCLYGSRGLMKVDQLSVQLGRNQLSEASAHSQEHVAAQLIPHPGFSPNSVVDDIALIKLATDITMTKYIQPVCLWNMEENIDLIVGKNGTVVGFGLTEHDRVSDYLRQAAIAVVDSWTCIASDRQVYGASLTGDMYCGGGRPGVSACNGDSGGGMFFELSDIWYVRGIVSFMPLRENVGLCDGTKYTVFTDVAKYSSWIKHFVTPTEASALNDPILEDNTRKLRLLNFNICGISPYTDGSNDDFFSYPWIGVLEVKIPGRSTMQSLCMVTLISEWYVVGPAHCLNHNDGMERTVRLGDFDISTDTDCIERNGTIKCAPAVQILPINRIYIRPDYNRLGIMNDLGLVELAQPANISQPNVRPICLPITVETRSYKPEMFVLGGLIAGGNRMVHKQPTYLNSVNCQERYNAIGSPLRKIHTQICANMLSANHTGPCDKMLSGAPLQTLQTFGRRERHFLQGLLSFGSRDCDPALPDVYTNVAFYLDWILYNMRDIRKDEPDTRERITEQQDLLSVSPQTLIPTGRPGNPPSKLKMSLTAWKVNACLVTFCVLTIAQTIALLECGERKIKTVYLVQHGTETKEGFWPWHTAIYHREGAEYNYVCGGSIIDHNTILTAAHCLYGSRGLMKVDQLSVQLGRNQLSEASAHSQEHVAAQLIPHPGFSPNSVVDDIALIKLATDITMTKYIQPVCLWNMEENIDLIVGKNGTVVGFGLTEHDRVSDYLRQAAIAVVDSWTCIASDRQVYGASLTGDMYCGGGRPGVSACNGDSGGGMFFELSDIWYVRGIVSFMPLRENVGLCDGTKYTVFTDVAKYSSWIKHFVTPTEASALNDPILEDNTRKLRLLNFNICGISPYTDGSNDDFFSYPWIGVLEVKIPGRSTMQSLCMVTLISEWYVVGPAHCLNHNDGMERTVRLGDFDISTDTDCIERNGTIKCAPAVQILPINRIYIRPDYNRLGIMNDLGLVELAQPANISQPNVRPICLPITVETRSYKPEMFVLGGLIAGGNRMVHKQPTYLNSVNCQERYNAIGSPLRKIHTQICANMLSANHTGPCDKMLSGAPLQTLQTFGRRERHFLQGLLSFGSRDCDPALPDVYTNVAFYLDWILYNMRDIRKDEPDTREQHIIRT